MEAPPIPSISDRVSAGWGGSEGPLIGGNGVGGERKVGTNVDKRLSMGYLSAPVDGRVGPC